MNIEWASNEKTDPARMFMRAVTLIDRAHLARHMENTFADVSITVNGRDIAPDVLIKALLSDPAALATTEEALPAAEHVLRLPPVTVEADRPITIVGKTAVLGVDTLQSLTNLVANLSQADKELIQALLSEREELLGTAHRLAAAPPPSYIRHNTLCAEYAALVGNIK